MYYRDAEYIAMGQRNGVLMFDGDTSGLTMPKEDQEITVRWGTDGVGKARYNKGYVLFNIYKDSPTENTKVKISYEGR